MRLFDQYPVDGVYSYSRKFIDQVCATHLIVDTLSKSHCVCVLIARVLCLLLNVEGVGSLNFVSDMNGCIASDEMSTAFAYVYHIPCFTSESDCVCGEVSF